MHTSQHNAKTLYLNWTDVKGKTKNTRGCYEILMFWTVVSRLKMVRVIEGKIVIEKV